MIQGNINNSPVRQVKGKVELFEGSTLLNTFTYRDRLISFTVERVGEESKFFGFGICQKLNVKLVDKDRELEITTNHSFKAYLTTGEDYVRPFPIFYVTEVHRDENTNELSITAYDLLYVAKDIPFDSTLIKSVIESGEGIATLNDYFALAAIQLGLPMKEITLMGVTIPIPPVDELNYPEEDELNVFRTEYPQGANLQGSESIKDVLDDLAEATQGVYYLDNKEMLIMKKLDKDGAAVLTISKSDYIDLDSKTNRRLVSIYHTTQLGDNVNEDENPELNKDYEAKLDISGTTQYVRDNAFWENREDIGTLVQNALAAIGGLTINQFDCSWRGNYLVEPGDKLDFVTKDNATVSSYLLNDSIEYDGSLRQKTSWKCEDTEGETASNPASLGEALNRTFARVDKINGIINTHAEQIKTNASNISDFTQTAEAINLSVSSLQKLTEENFERYDGEFDEIEKKVDLALNDEEVTIKINQALANGVSRVETTTGFTFDDKGLTVSKSDSDISTLIDETGMKVSIGNDPDPVLAADHNGVNAMNLTARQYLIMGQYSRIQDVPNQVRTGCFWIGG